jgi:hypothetical protein
LVTPCPPKFLSHFFLETPCPPKSYHTSHSFLGTPSPPISYHTPLMTFYEDGLSHFLLRLPEYFMRSPFPTSHEILKIW